MFHPKRFALVAFAALATVAAVGTASAQSWPTRPVTMVVPFAAGSSSDTAGRVLAVGFPRRSASRLSSKISAAAAA